MLLLLLPYMAYSEEIGTITGSFDVTLDGSSSYAIPIRIAPGTAGTEPKISIAYDSQSPGGSLGAGWSVVGLSTITRGPKSLYFDHEVAGVNLDESDALYLDGQRLVAISRTGTDADTRTEYRKEVDDQTRIVQTGLGLGTSDFTVNAKGGLRIVFDGANNSKIRLSDGTVLLQAVSRIYDTVDNYMEFRYSGNGQGDYNVQSIRYTGHETVDAAEKVISNQRPYASIEFVYEKTARALDAYVAGRVIHRDLRLKEIISRIALERDDSKTLQWTTVARYEFEYADRDKTANRFVLAKVHQFGESGTELVPTSFDYSEPTVGWEVAKFQLPVALAVREGLGAAYRFAHVSGSGALSSDGASLPDLLFAAQVEGTLEAFGFRNDGAGNWTRLGGLAPPFAFASADGVDLGAVVADVNGDGRADLLQSDKAAGAAPERSAFVAGADKWEPADGYKLPFTVTEDGRVVGSFLIARFSGGSAPDLVYQAPDGEGFRTNDGNKWIDDTLHAPPIPLDARARAYDIDCDGVPELVGVGVDAAGSPTWKAFRFKPGGWEEIQDSAFKIPLPADVDAEAIREIDLNGDACMDLIVATAQGAGLHAAYLASKTGWTPALPPAVPGDMTPQFDLVDGQGNASGAIVVDVDNDMRADVIAHRDLQSGPPIQFAFKQSSSGWKPLPAKFIPPPLGSIGSNQPPLHVFVGDIDGDDLPDIVLPSGSRESFGHVFAGTASGFEPVPGLAPDVPFARRDQQDLGTRFVDLNADGLPDLLVRRDVTGQTSPVVGAYLNTGQGWTRDVIGLHPPVSFASDDITGNPAEFADVNGDGYIDLLYHYRTKTGALSSGLYINDCDTGGGGKCTDINKRKWTQIDPKDPHLGGLVPDNPTGELKDYPFSAYGQGDLGVRLADLNGDGRVDLVAAVARGGNASEPIKTCTTSNGHETCEWNRRLFHTAAFINDGKSWVRAPSFDPPVPFVALPSSQHSKNLFVELIDINGDGLPDIVASFVHPFDEHEKLREIWMNTGSGWRLEQNYTWPLLPAQLGKSEPLLLDEPARDQKALIQWLDVDGDGPADIVFTKREGGNNFSHTWLSTGRGFVEAKDWQVPLEAISDQRGDPSFRPIDVNGDGLVDLLFARTENSANVTRGVFVNNGSAWVKEDPSKIGNIPAFLDKEGLDQGVRLLDVDGNRLPDVVQSFAEGSSAGSKPLGMVLVNSGRRADVLSSIDTGYSVKTSLFYQTMLEATPPDQVGEAVDAVVPWERVYEPGTPGQYPLIAPVPASYVVRRAIVDEGPGRRVAFSYRYGNFRVHAEAMRSLGFGWRESIREGVRNIIEAVLTRTERLQDIRFRNSVVREAKCWIKLDQRLPGQKIPDSLCPEDSAKPVPWALKLTETQNKWGVRAAKVGGGALPLSTIRQISLAQTSNTTFELDKTVVSSQTDSFEYDEPADLLRRRMNVMRTVSVRGDGTSVETRNEYAQDDESRWFFARLTKATVTKIGNVVAPGSGVRSSETRVAGFTYDDATGLLSSETTNLGQAKAVTTTYRRDEYSNITATTVSAEGEQPRTSRSEFDAYGRFTVTEIDPLGHVIAKARRPTDGLPTRIVDPNGLGTAYEYDGFGRPVKETAPTGVVTRTEMLRPVDLGDNDALIGIQAAYAVRTTTGTLPPAVALMDNKGRVLRTVTEGFTKDATKLRPIQRDTEYDPVGRISRASLPYERNGRVLFARSDYDVLDRLYRTTAPNGAVTEIQFAGRTGGGSIKTVIDPLLRRTITETNMQGLPLSVMDAIDGVVRYEYDAGDRLLRVVGPTGAATRHSYNDIGQRIETVDPDMGDWRYDYDAFGQITRQVDAKGQVSTVQYDLLGRPTRKVQPDATFIWEYDTARGGVGKLASASGSDGYREDYYYDRFGRQSQWAVTIDREHMVTYTEFDDLSRIAEIHYPDGAVVANRYDGKGYLAAVVRADDGTPFWTADAYDENSRVTSERYGNGVTTTRTFEKETGRLERIEVKGSANAAAPGLLDLKLDYDLVGNVVQRDDQVAGVNDTFKYDELNRLTSFDRKNAQPETYSYDASGRMTFKSGVGMYMYAATGPFHAVSATMGGNQTTRYNYDQNGNMVGNEITVIEYGSDNRVRQLFNDVGNWSKFDYAPDGNRYRQVEHRGRRVLETLYIGGYERLTDSLNFDLNGSRSLVRHRHYMVNAEGVFAVL